MAEKLKWIIPRLNNISKARELKKGFADCIDGSGDSAACSTGNAASVCNTGPAAESCANGSSAITVCGGGGGGSCVAGGGGD